MLFIVFALLFWHDPQLKTQIHSVYNDVKKRKSKDPSPRVLAFQMWIFSPFPDLLYTKRLFVLRYLTNSLIIKHKTQINWKKVKTLKKKTFQMSRLNFPGNYIICKIICDPIKHANNSTICVCVEFVRVTKSLTGSVVSTDRLGATKKPLWLCVCVCVEMTEGPLWRWCSAFPSLTVFVNIYLSLQMLHKSE